MRRRIAVEPGNSLVNLLGAAAAEDRVDQAVELVGELRIGERVLVVARGKGDLFDRAWFRRPA